MHIGLIAMSGVRIRTRELAELGVTLPGFVRRGQIIASLPSLGLLTVAGLTPAHHQVTYLEVDEVESLGALPDFDLVGISSFTAMIDDAYQLADRYRERSVPVVLGGIHASLLPHEAKGHADAVVVGGAELAWPRLLQDLESGHLEPFYMGATRDVFSAGSYAVPRFDLLAGRPYNRVTVQTSRGCPRGCEFCASSPRITTRFNQKPVSLVLDEIRLACEHFEHPFVELADDNTFLDPGWSRELLRAMAREDIRYFTETDASVADDAELCDLLAASGCRQVLIGFESPDPDDLTGIDVRNWKRERAPGIKRVIDTLQTRGVSVNGCFVLGLDRHTTDVFPALLDFVRESGLAEVQYTVLTPFPGTALYRRLAREGRLLRERFWDRCTLFDVNFVPAKMSVDELESGMRWLFRETYTEAETARRTGSYLAHVRRGRKDRQSTSDMRQSEGVVAGLRL